VEDMCQQLGVTPTLDCFAAPSNARFPNFITEEQDSLRCEWSRDEILWLNPPWRLWPQAAEKLYAASGAALVVCPAWNKPWVKQLVGMASRRVYYERGTRVFEVDGHPCDGTLWGTWALRVDKGPRKELDPTEVFKKCIYCPGWRPMGHIGTKPKGVRPQKGGLPVVSPEGQASGSPKPDTSQRDVSQVSQWEAFHPGKPEWKHSEQWAALFGVASEVTPQIDDPGKAQVGVRRMFDLFSGTGTVGRVFEAEGYEVTSLDVIERFHPTIVADILTWDYRAAFRPGHFDVIFCAPPCDHFSCARTTAPRDLELADALVQRALEVIRYLQPRRWFMENPRGGLLSGRPYMADIPFVDVDYCQFSLWGYQKPTRIWGDPLIKTVKERVCDGVSCPNVEVRPNGRRGHRKILGGNNIGVTRNQKYRIPEGLVRYLAGLPDSEEVRRVVDYIRLLRLDPLPDMTVRWLPEPEDLQQWAEKLCAIGQGDHFVNGVVVANKELDGEMAATLRAKMLGEYQGTVFSNKSVRDPPVRGPFGEATITLKPGVTPRKQRPFQMHGERLEAWKKLIDQLIEDGKIEEGVSDWNSPSFPVAKKESGKWRLVDDFRLLNDATITDAHPMPLIQPILNKQGKCRVWSVLDMKDGYHQIPLRKEDRHYTCMSTPRGTYQWKVLVMGLKNGGAIFQRVMEWILKPCKAADPYIDDVIVGTEGATLEEAIEKHEQDLREVLEQLKLHQMVVDPRKAHLFMEEVEFCGHVLSAGRRRPAPGKLLSIQKWDLPQTVTELRGFLGLTNYYSEYVDHYAEKAGVLMSKLQLNRVDGKKGSKVKLVWRQTEVQAFEQLKEMLAKELELFIIDPDKPFVLRADASDKAIGAVLEQERVLKEGSPPVRVPVGFFSRKLGKSQLNWTPREKETYAIVAALRKWSGWVGLQPVLVTTDHKSLEDWVVEKMDTPSGPAGRRARWHETLSKFDLTVQYVPGADNVVADAMSRFAYPACKAFQDVSFHGSAQAKEEMRQIIQEELEEGRMVALILGQKPHRPKHCCYVAGPLRRSVREKLSPHSCVRTSR
jgi:hypothetical protein